MLISMRTILILCLVTLVVSQLRARVREEGDVCFIPSGGNPAWVCELFQRCPPAVRLIKERKSPPTGYWCGFKELQPVVCCPPYEISDWSSDEPVSKSKPSSAQQVADAVTTITITANTTTYTVVVSTAGNAEGYDKATSKAAAKCEEYRQFYRSSFSFTKIVIMDGVNYTAYFEIGGEAAKPKEFLHTALLGYGTRPTYHCSGSLISEKFVLSAAHCKEHPNFGLVRAVILGDLDANTQTADSAPRTYFVVRRYVHEGYKPKTLHHDIMLLELDTAVKLNHYIKPVCLHTSKDINADKGIMTGWDLTEAADGSPNRVLRKVELPFVSRTKCNDAFRSHVDVQHLKFGIVDDTQFCAGTGGNLDSCEANSGGPLQIPAMVQDGSYMQVGVASLGRGGCGAAEFSGVYTRVSAYINWIESIVWP